MKNILLAACAVAVLSGCANSGVSKTDKSILAVAGGRVAGHSVIGGVGVGVDSTMSMTPNAPVAAPAVIAVKVQKEK